MNWLLEQLWSQSPQKYLTLKIGEGQIGPYYVAQAALLKIKVESVRVRAGLDIQSVWTDSIAIQAKSVHTD